jgi:hypothetical protein
MWGTGWFLTARTVRPYRFGVSNAEIVNVFQIARFLPNAYRPETLADA